MFNDFINGGGSFLAMFLMALGTNIITRTMDEHGAFSVKLHGPGGLGALLSLTPIPVNIWMATYFGLYEGLYAGIAAWFVVQIILTGITKFFMPSNVGYLFNAASFAMVIGIILSVSTLP